MGPDLTEVFAEFRAQKLAILLYGLLEVLQDDGDKDFYEDQAHDQDIGEEKNPRLGLISAPDCFIYFNYLI